MNAERKEIDMKRILAIALSAIVLFTLSACSSGETVKVKSLDYPTLNSIKEQEITKEAIEEHYKKTIYANTDDSGATYYTVTNFVPSVINGELVISKSKSVYPEISAIRVPVGDFYGINHGEFGGWVKFEASPDNPDEWYADGRLQTVCEENCRGFLYANENETEIYLFTGLAHLGLDEGRVWRLWAESTERPYEWKWEILAELPSCPNDFHRDEETGTVYIACNRGLLSMTPDGTITDIEDYGLFERFGAGAIAELDGRLWISTYCGVASYDIGTGELKWFPIYIKK